MTELPVVASKPIWNRPFKLNLGAFFAAISKLGIDLAIGQRTEAFKDAVDAVAAFGLAREPQELAGLLINRAAMRAIAELIEPYRADFPAVIYPGPPNFERELDEATIVLDERFLEHPRNLPIVARLQELVEQWLGHVNLHGPVATTIAARLPARFVNALRHECIEHRSEYARLFEVLHSEFGAAWQRERSWEEYQHWFESELNGPVFVEDFGLPQIFQWPRAYYVENPNPSSVGRGERQEESRRVVELRETLDRWLDERSREDAIRVISGEPGAGKSSFTRMYAAHRMRLGDRLLVIPLHTLNVANDLREAIISMCREAPPYPNDPFEISDGPLLLILDGLDELAKQGHSGSLLARDFAGHVQRAVDSRNLGSTVRLRVILSGRPIAVQDVAESDFRAVGQVLHLVPYAVMCKPEDTWKWVDPEARLANDQRHSWWQRYGDLIGTPHSGLPESLASETLLETTTQPLLGYLLALVQRDAFAKGQTLERDVSRNEIYARLIHAVFDRDYDQKPSSGRAALRCISRHDFDALLDEMALAAWHEDVRVVRVSAVERLCDKAGLRDVLERYVETSHVGVAQLFTAFYFRRSGTRTRGEETFEFTHKSFAEYLVARRFVVELTNVAKSLAERDASKGRRGRGKDEQALLLDWLEVFGPSVVTRDLLPYLETEVRLRAASDNVGLWQDTLIRLINWVLREGMPCELITPGFRFIEMTQRAANAEMALLVMLQCCSGATERMSEIDWPNELACGDWLRRLCAKDRWLPLPLRRVSMVEQVLRAMNLENAELANSDLASANLWNANLMNVNLQDADLWETDLENANLGNAKMRGADLWRANLVNANLANAELVNADLGKADLMSANLWNANLSNANLWHANLANANLANANLTNVNLWSGDLRNANLTNANLAGVDLRRAKVTPQQLAVARGTPAYFPDDE